MCQIPKNHTNLLSTDITSIFIFVMKNRRKIIEEYGHQSRPSISRISRMSRLFRAAPQQFLALIN